jgi:ATP adenylyltransferase
VDEFSESVGEVGRDARHDQPGVGVEDLQRLWAPWRFGYVAGAEPLRGCPFCVLPDRGPERDRESLILHRGAHAFVIFNAYPYNPGHLMVVPYAHVADLEDLDGECAAEVWHLAQRAVRVLKERVHAQGVNLGMNLGAAGGAGIAEHLHLHAVPRWIGDTNFITVVGAARVLPRALDEMWDELAPGFADLPSPDDAAAAAEGWSST